MMIDCETCTARPAACTDCVVTFLLAPAGPRSRGTVELDAGERQAIDVLAASGLVPPLRMDRTG